MLLGPQGVIATAAVDQAPLLAIQESLHKNVVLIFPVEAEGLQIHVAVRPRASNALIGLGLSLCPILNPLSFSGDFPPSLTFFP